MANYTIVHQSVGSPTVATNTVVVFEPTPLLSATLTGQPAQYFLKGDVVSDTNLGGAGAVTRLQGLGAIA